jgi:FixJ family two-component response regulator
MAAQGLANREIAQALFVSLRTVETHLTHAYKKLGIGSREALSAALETAKPAEEPADDDRLDERAERAAISRRPLRGPDAEPPYEALQRGRGRR